MAQPFSDPEPQVIKPITLPPVIDIQVEEGWLRQKLQQWLDREFIPEAINAQIAARCAQIFMRQRLEGETDLGELVMAIVTEMKGFNFTESFYSEFAVANAVSDLVLESLGFDTCCGY
jgi:hypothetical protein